MTKHFSDGFGEPEALLHLPNGWHGGGLLHLPEPDIYIQYTPVKVLLILALHEARQADLARGGLGWRGAESVLRLMGKHSGICDPSVSVSRMVCDTNRLFAKAVPPGLARLIESRRQTGYRLLYRLRIILPPSSGGELPAEE